MIYFEGLKCHLHFNFMVLDVSYILALYLRENITNAGLWDEA